MAKASNRKHATHRKARANNSAKTHARRPGNAKASNTRVMNPPEIVPEPEMVGEDIIVERIETRVVDENLEDEPGIYGADRGEDAGG